MPFVLWTSIVTAIVCALLGVFAYVKNARAISNRSFCVFNLALAVWTPTDLIKQIADPHLALAIYRLTYVGGSFITFAFLTFMWDIAGYKKRWIYYSAKWSAIAFAILSQTPLLVQSIRFDIHNFNPIEEIHGPLYNLFSIFFVLSLLCAIVPMVAGYRKFTGLQKKQVQHVMAAFFFGFVAVLNFFANQVNEKIPPLFYLFVMGMNTTFALAITKHRLMDITVIVRKTLIYSMVTGPLILAYVLLISVFTRMFAGLSGYQTYASSFVAAALITFCFQPLRRRVQNFVDKKFFRQFVDREEKLYELSRDVITHTTPEAMAQALMRVLGESFHPKTAALYLRQRDGAGFSLASTSGNSSLPQMVREDNALAQFFAIHPQPFIEDSTGSIAKPQSTRDLDHKERPAA